MCLNNHAYLTTKDTKVITKDSQYIGKILQQDPSIATGAGHHSVIRIPGTEKHYIVYHRRPPGQKDRNARETCIDKIEFDKNGFIKPVVITKEGVPAQKIRSGISVR